MTYGTAQRQLDTPELSAHNLLVESMQLYQPVLACAVGKTCQHYFCRRQERRLKGITAGLHSGNIFPSVVLYIYIRSHLVSFLCSILCATVACITMPRLNIETSRRLVECS